MQFSLMLDSERRQMKVARQFTGDSCLAAKRTQKIEVPQAGLNDASLRLLQPRAKVTYGFR